MSNAESINSRSRNARFVAQAGNLRTGNHIQVRYVRGEGISSVWDDADSENVWAIVHDVSVKHGAAVVTTTWGIWATDSDTPVLTVNGEAK